MRFKLMLCCGVAAGSLLAGTAEAATINLVDLGGVGGSPAERGFNVAAAFWGKMFTNDVTINLGVSFAPLDPGVIGSTGSRKADFTVTDWENGWNATRSNSTIDRTAILPTLTGGGISGVTQGVGETGDNDVTLTQPLDGKRASQVLYANSSVIKAVGGALASPDALDGAVTFSSTFGFDFNPGNGVAPETFDFIGVAIHEIGHALGFVSGVDFFDYYGFPDGPGAGALGYDLNDTSIFSALDMFRYGAPGEINLTVGGAPYFSIDGGATALFDNVFSTGAYQGDGNQASHWQDAEGANACGPQLGIMDPTFCYQQKGFVTGLDLAAFDAMGWNLSVDALRTRGFSTTQILRSYLGTAVPEPSSWAMMIAGFGLVGATMRRRNTALAQATA